MRTTVAVLAAFALAAAAGCSMTSSAKNFGGLSTPDGQAIAQVNTTNYAIHLLFKDLVVGNASLEQTVADMTAQAKGMGAAKVRIVQSSSSTLWYILPPFSFVMHPVITNVAADALPYNAAAQYVGDIGRPGEAGTSLSCVAVCGGFCRLWLAVFTRMG